MSLVMKFTLLPPGGFLRILYQINKDFFEKMLLPGDPAEAPN